ELLTGVRVDAGREDRLRRAGRSEGGCCSTRQVRRDFADRRPHTRVRVGLRSQGDQGWRTGGFAERRRNAHRRGSAKAAEGAPLMPTVYVNDRPVEIGTSRLNCIQAADMGGVFVPHYCWHEALSVVASCRMCLVEMGERKPDGTIVMQPKVVP